MGEKTTEAKAQSESSNALPPLCLWERMMWVSREFQMPRSRFPSLPYLLLLYLHLLCRSILGRWLTSTTLRDMKIHLGLQWFNSESHSLSLPGLWIVSGFITPETHVVFSAEADDSHSVTGILWGIWGCPAARAGQLLCSSFHALPKFMGSEGWRVRISFSVLALNSSQDVKQNGALQDALNNDWSDFANFPNTHPPLLFESSSS